MFKAFRNLLLSLGIAGTLLFWGTIISLAVGYVANIIQLVIYGINTSVVTLSNILILKLIGLLIGPLGGVMGLIGLFN